MVRVGVVGMVVVQRRVTVPMGVRNARCHRLGMRVLMVQIMLMHVLVFQRRMRVAMLVVFAQVQPGAQGH